MMVLCRVNAPLVQLCLYLVKKGYKARVQGKEMAKPLLECVDALHSQGRLDLEGVNWYYTPKIDEKLAYKQTSKAAYLETLRDSLIFFITANDEVGGRKHTLINLINNTLVNGEGDILLSSIHKMKGAEAKKVAIIRPYQVDHYIVHT